MTQAASTPYNSYNADGSTDTFAYQFRIGATAEIQVYLNTVLQAEGYTVTGVGNPAGGNVVFAVMPEADTLVHLRRQTAVTQLTDYQPGDAFPADTHEGALDKLTRAVQDHDEVLERIPSFGPTAVAALRNLRLPTPIGGRVLGWNTLGDAYTLYERNQYSFLQAPARSQYDAVAYGADNTGVDDAQPALQALLDLAQDQGGGLVWLPVGVYNLGSALRLRRGVSLMGYGAPVRGPEGVDTNVYATTLRYVGPQGGTVVWPEEWWDSTLANLTIDGNNLAQFLLLVNRSPCGATFRTLQLRRSLAGAGGSSIYLKHETDLPFAPALNVFDRVVCSETGAHALWHMGGTQNLYSACMFLGSADVDTVLILAVDWGVTPGSNGADTNAWQSCFVTVQAGKYGVAHNYGTLPQGGFNNNWFDSAIVGPGTPIYAANNDFASHFTRCYLYNSNDPPYVIDTDGQIALHQCLYNTPGGRPNGFYIVPTGSPFTYTNATPWHLDVSVYGGTVSVVEITRNGGSAPWTGALSTVGRTFPLEPGDGLIVTYTDIPFMHALPEG